MDAIEIDGGVPLRGETTVSGSKNASLPMLCAALLAPGRSRFFDVPDLADLRTMGRLFGHMGCTVERSDAPERSHLGHTLVVDATDLPTPEAPYELVKTMRASVLVLGPLLARLGRARVSLPGGCAIGARPIDQHLKGLAALGAKIELAHGYVEAQATRLKGARFLFDLPTVTGGDVLVRRAPAAHLEAAISKLREAGAHIAHEGDGLRVTAPHRPEPVDLITAPHPGFPTDLQAQLMACLSVAKGASRVVETVFENRFMHVQELQRLGADISVEGHTAVVKGVPLLQGAQVMATDLRASASLVLAGLRAEGTTTVGRVYHLDRGYESLEKKLSALGARIRRVKGG